MRYEFSDDERTAIKPMLPNKPRGVWRGDDRRVLDGSSWFRRAMGDCRRPIVPARPVTIASFGG
jgi:transposase